MCRRWIGFCAALVFEKSGYGRRIVKKELNLRQLFLQMGLAGLLWGLVACGPAEEPTPLPVVAATEVLVVETAVSSTDTPIPATAAPDTEANQLAVTSTPVTAEIEAPASASVTGIDSGIIAFTNVGESVNLYALVPGQAPVQMSYAAGLSYGANWSPSGQRIAYFFLDGLTQETDLWYFDIASGPEPAPITTGGAANDVDRLSWSADSEFLVYAAPQPDGAESDVYRVSIASGEVVNLTAESAAWDASPDWSPDGEWVVFVSDRAEAGKASDNLWLMNSEGGDLRQLTNSDATFQEDIEPSWSPDGRQIAFFRHSLLGDSLDETRPSGLWLVDVGTGEETALVHITGFLVGAQPPVWSPDGRWLAYNAPGVVDTDIWVVSAAGGEPINVSNLPGEDATISWSPNSQELIFTNTNNGKMSQLIVGADGSALSLLVQSGENGLGSWSP